MTHPYFLLYKKGGGSYGFTWLDHKNGDNQVTKTVAEWILSTTSERREQGEKKGTW